MTRTASCHCGQLALSCAAEPVKISACHCEQCQRRTGSLFSVAAFFPREAVSVARGAARTYRRPSASGFDVTFHFCPDCGTSLWWVAERLPDLVGVAVGAFADPHFPMPEQAVWAEDRHHWLEFPASVPSHARNPARAPPIS